MSDKPRKQLPTSVQKVVGGRGGGNGGQGGGTNPDKPYTPEEISAALSEAQPSVAKLKKKQSKTAAPIMADYLCTIRPFNEAGYKTKAALVTSCEGWFDRPSSFAAVVQVAPRLPLVGPTLEYGATHGDLHFINKPTNNKSAWTLEKGPAIALMESELRRWLGPLGKHSASNESMDGWTTFYVTGQHTSDVGTYWGADKIDSTSYFTMQVQVRYEDNLVSYHGYPDDKMEGKPKLGCKKGLFGPALN